MSPMESRTRRQTASHDPATPVTGPSAAPRVVSFKLDDETYADLATAARADGRSVSGLLRLLVRNHLASDGASA